MLGGSNQQQGEAHGNIFNRKSKPTEIILDTQNV
jgi:hypothetical protein